jgi:phage I-like protein
MLGFAQLPQGDPPGELLLFGYGEVAFRWGDEPPVTYLFTQEDAQEVVRRAALRGVELPVDYDHRTQQPVDNGPVPAAGWFTLEARPDGLYAVNLRWTERAAALIAAGEYRYWSPVFWVEDGHIRQVDMIGLTNQPATIDQRPLVASRQGEPMREKLIALLGLAADATDEQIEAALAELQARAGQLEQAQALLAEAGITAAPGSDEAHGQAMALAANAQLAQRVVELEAELAQLRSAQAVGEAEAAVDAALSEGRIHAASRAYWIEKFKQNPRAVRAHFASLKPGAVVPIAPSAQPQTASVQEGLSETEKLVIAQTGVSAEKFLETKRRLEAKNA